MVWRVTQRDWVIICGVLGLWTWAPRVLVFIVAMGIAYHYKRRVMARRRIIIPLGVEQQMAPLRLEDIRERGSSGLMPLVFWSGLALLGVVWGSYEPSAPVVENPVVMTTQPAPPTGAPGMAVPMGGIVTHPEATGFPPMAQPRYSVTQAQPIGGEKR